MTEFDQERMLFSGGHNNSLIEQPNGNQSRGKRPLIMEEDDDDSLSDREGPRILKQGHPEIPQYRPSAPSSAIRKDSFSSYFNPANWFKWGKERKLARQAARTINDPRGNAGTSLSAKHWAALNTTHGQRMLKNEAKASAKSDATGWNSKIEAFTKNQFHNRQWEQYGHQAAGSNDAWRRGIPQMDFTRPLPAGAVKDDRYGYLYPQGDGYDPGTAASMSQDELREAKEDSAFSAKAQRDENRQAAKKSRTAPFKSSGDMFADIEALDPKDEDDSDSDSGSVELIQEKPKAQAPVHESIDDDDDDDLGYKPMAADFMNMDLDQETQNKNIAKLMGWK